MTTMDFELKLSKLWSDHKLILFKNTFFFSFLVLESIALVEWRMVSRLNKMQISKRLNYIWRLILAIRRKYGSWVTYVHMLLFWSIGSINHWPIKCLYIYHKEREDLLIHTIHSQTFTENVLHLMSFSLRLTKCKKHYVKQNLCFEN